MQIGSADGHDRLGNTRIHRGTGPRSLCRAFFALYRSNLMAWKGSPFVNALFLDDPAVPTRRPWAGQAFDGQEGVLNRGATVLPVARPGHHACWGCSRRAVNGHLPACVTVADTSAEAAAAFRALT